jgi:hypothetical protein
VLRAEQRLALAVAVAAVAQLTEELVHQVAPVGEDEDAARAVGVHEAHGGDVLPAPVACSNQKRLPALGSSPASSSTSSSTSSSSGRSS